MHWILQHERFNFDKDAPLTHKNKEKTNEKQKEEQFQIEIMHSWAQLKSDILCTTQETFLCHFNTPYILWIIHWLLVMLLLTDMHTIMLQMTKDPCLSPSTCSMTASFLMLINSTLSIQENSNAHMSFHWYFLFKI